MFGKFLVSLSLITGIVNVTQNTFAQVQGESEKFAEKAAYVQTFKSEEIGSNGRVTAQVKFTRDGSVLVRGGIKRGGKFYGSIFGKFYRDKTVRGEKGDTVTVTIDYPLNGNLIGGNSVDCEVIE